MFFAQSRHPFAFVAASSGFALIGLLGACSSSTEEHIGDDGSGGNNPAAGSGGRSADGGSSASGGRGSPTSGSGGYGGQTLSGIDAAVVTKLCGDRGCACSNGIDDDGDGQIDGFDTECTGPLDDDESSFATGIPGDNRDPKWQDCFFDGNSGAGDDRCRYPTTCLTGELAPTDPACALKEACIDFCADRAPNGCDCFGCCTIGSGPSAVNIRIEGTCSVAKLGDETACPRCTKSITCGNECGECELCPGKTAADLPPSCIPVNPPPPPYDSGTPPVYPPNNTCDPGKTPCASTAGCAIGEYCQQGCCVPIVR